MDETTEEMSERIKKNEKALKALEDVPSILGELVKKVGIQPGVNQHAPGEWSLGLSDDEDGDHIDIDDDANKMIETGN